MQSCYSSAQCNRIRTILSRRAPVVRGKQFGCRRLVACYHMLGLGLGALVRPASLQAHCGLHRYLERGDMIG
jgi:hypothetical protein